MFDGLSFALAGGTALVITGANGIGKSSLLRTVAGLVGLTDGALALDGGDTELSVAEHCHYFGHQNANKTALTVTENLGFWRAFTAGAAPKGFDASVMTPKEALDLLGIAHTARLPAGFLSAGQSRRLALARLLVTARPVWLMDEPTSALDTASEALLLGLMNAHLARGGLILTATHGDLALAPVQTLHLSATDPVETAHD